MHALERQDQRRILDSPSQEISFFSRHLSYHSVPSPKARFKVYAFGVLAVTFQQVFLFIFFLILAWLLIEDIRDLASMDLHALPTFQILLHIPWQFLFRFHSLILVSTGPNWPRAPFPIALTGALGQSPSIHVPPLCWSWSWNPFHFMTFRLTPLHGTFFNLWKLLEFDFWRLKTSWRAGEAISTHDVSHSLYSQHPNDRLFLPILYMSQPNIPNTCKDQIFLFANCAYFLIFMP
jgi:hypothetical protein